MQNPVILSVQPKKDLVWIYMEYFFLQDHHGKISSIQHCNQREQFLLFFHFKPVFLKSLYFGLPVVLV